MDGVEFTPEEQTYLAEAMRVIGDEHGTTMTLTDLLDRWVSFVSIMDTRSYLYDIELAAEIWYRQEIDEFILSKATPALHQKIEGLVGDADNVYRLKTVEVPRPWFGNGGLQGWYWYRQRTDLVIDGGS